MHAFRITFKQGSWIYEAMQFLTNPYNSDSKVATWVNLKILDTGFH